MIGYIMDFEQKKMRYTCKQCEHTFQTKGDADSHEHETGHKVELAIQCDLLGSPPSHSVEKIKREPESGFCLLEDKPRSLF